MSKKVTVYGSRCIQNPDHSIQFWLNPHSMIHNNCSCGKVTSYEGSNHYDLFRVDIEVIGKDYGAAYDSAVAMMNSNPEGTKVEWNALGETKDDVKIKKNRK